MHLSEIWIYPVKSLGGMRVKEAKVLEKGLQYDRRWVVVDENGVFLTQRANGKMALIDVLIKADSLMLSDQKLSEDFVHVPLETSDGDDIEVRVWKDVVLAKIVGGEVNDWLSRKLGQKVRLIRMSNSTNRQMDPEYAQPGALVSFADDFPYLLICQESLDDLNTRLAEPVGMKRFRPNFIVTGGGPFEEDRWSKISINGLTFSVSKPCERCVVVNIDPETGSKGLEPLKTLAGYRRENRKIMFGQNLVSLQTGIVREADPVVVLS